MRRRFLQGAAGFAAAALAFPLARAQTTKRMPRVGYVWIFDSGPSRPFVVAFRRRMAELGWIDGNTVAIETHNAGGDPQKLGAIMKELVDTRADVILASCTPEAKAAMRYTTTIPIVVAAMGDPLAAGIAKSYARPGGNVTGVSGMLLEQSAKRLALLKEAAPRVSRATVIWNPERPDNKVEVDAMVAGAKALGVVLESQQVRTPAELSDVLDLLPSTGTQALLNAGDNMLGSLYVPIVDFTRRRRLPSMFEDRFFVQNGGLMSYGPNFEQMHAMAAEYVDKVLRGANPGELPIVQPRKFELVINRTAAKQIGVSIPATLLVQADEVIG